MPQKLLRKVPHNLVGEVPQNLVGEVPQKLKGGVQGEPWFPFKEGSKGNLGSLLRRGLRGTIVTLLAF